MLVLAEGDLPVQRWKNGLGETRQIAIHPANATVATGFDWRVSMADVLPGSTPFSSFPGVQRALCSLGRPFLLIDTASQSEIGLVSDSLLVFSGEKEVSSVLKGDEKVTDFGVMWRPKAVRAEFGTAHFAAGPFARGAAGGIVVYVVAGAVEVNGQVVKGGQACVLENEPLSISSADGGARVLWASFDERPENQS